MAMLWTIHELLTLFMFWNLPALHLQEQLERIEVNADTTQPAVVSDVQRSSVDAEIASMDCAVSPAMLFIPQQPVYVAPSVAPRAVHRVTSAEHQLDTSDVSSVTMSNEFIEEAEVFMNAEPDSPGVAVSSAIARDSSMFFADALQNLSWPCVAVSPIRRTNSDSLLHRRHQLFGAVKRDDVGRNVLPVDGLHTDNQSGMLTARDTELPHVAHETSTTAEPDQPSNSLTWQYYYDG